MGPTNFPLRWESTGDQWWFASPIDWAAANGHYDIVRELLRIDPNLLIKLTSLPRIRRLETVWDDDFGDAAAKCRSQVAQRLLQECETKKGGHNSLMGAGYGGWLLYTAASAGDAVFVGELLSRDPLLVFGEGEYGVTDMFYAAARSRNSDVFGMLFDCSVSPRGLKEPVVSGVFRSEMVNRAVHAAAGGGSVEVLRGLLEDGGDVVLVYRDDGGSTVLHTASGRGQVEVVNHLISSHDILNSVDNRGNTALHVAAYHGQLPVLDLLVSASPSTALLTNNYGDTFLHMAVSGFCAPSFRRMDRQTELMKQIIRGNNKLMKINMEDIINIKNNKGRTALHVAVIVNVRSDIVELLMSARSVNLNIRDADGYTPLDLLRQRPRSVDSEILIERLISAGGISDCLRNALVTHLMTRHAIGAGSTTPGTSFGIPDAEILLYAGIEDLGSSSCDLMCSVYGSNSSKCQTFGPMKSATRRLKNILHWPGKHDKSYNNAGFSDLEDNCSVDSYRVGFSSSLRQQFSKKSILRNNKRIVSLPGGDFPSPSTKKKFVRGLTQGVLQVIPRPYFGSPASAISESSWSSPVSTDRRRDVAQQESVDSPKMKGKQGSFNLRLMNSYLCFGAQSLGVEKSVGKSQKQEM